MPLNSPITLLTSHEHNLNKKHQEPFFAWFLPTNGQHEWPLAIQRETKRFKEITDLNGFFSGESMFWNPDLVSGPGLQPRHGAGGGGGCAYDKYTYKTLISINAELMYEPIGNIWLARAKYIQERAGGKLSCHIYVLRKFEIAFITLFFVLIWSVFLINT